MRLFSWLRRNPSQPKPVPLEVIRRSFNVSAADEEHFPSHIDPRIYHVQLLLEHFGSLDGARVLDVGCGKGRFARVLKEQHPGAVVVGFDLAEAMLGFVPPSVLKTGGSMTSLPYRSESFDAVYATESLEHAVDIDAAVAEMCRVLRPNGKLVIIDKNSEHWGRLETPAWEKWFSRGELETKLKRHCREVRSDFISYWQDVPPDGLFLAWLARK